MGVPALFIGGYSSPSISGAKCGDLCGDSVRLKSPFGGASFSFRDFVLLGQIAGISGNAKDLGWLGD